MAIDWPTPPTMPPNCPRLTTNITSQYHSSQLTRSRGPGTSFMAAMVILPEEMA